jgi:hypothetical protein
MQRIRPNYPALGPIGETMESIQPLPGDRRAGAFAYAAGAVGIITFTALGLMYGVEMSRPGPRLFGPISDIGSGLFNLLAIPVIIQLHKHLPASQWRGPGLALVVVLSVAGAIGSFLLVAKVLGFTVATTAATLALAAQAVWLVAAHTKLLKRGGYPMRLAKLGRFVGAAFLAGAAIVAFGFLVPGGWMQWTVFGIGGLIGLTGWVGMPFWFLMAGRRLVHEHSAPSTSPTPKPSPASSPEATAGSSQALHPD